MCLSPIKIKNRSNVKYLTPYKKLKEWDNIVYDTHDTLLVPCGKCEECYNASLNHYLDGCLYYSNDYYPFFISASVKDEFLEYKNFISFVPSSYINRFFRNLVINDIISSDYHYVAVKERGSESDRPHCHFLLFLPKSYVRSFCPYRNKSDLYYADFFAINYVKKIWSCWSINVGTRKNPIYKQVCDYIVRGRKTTFSVQAVDISTVDKSMYYLLKYQFKQRQNKLDNLSKYASHQGKLDTLLVSNKILVSKYFHKWINNFIDSNYCKWLIHPTFNIIWPHLVTTSKVKPISYRSYTKVLSTLDDVYEVKNCMQFVESDIIDRFTKAETRRLKRLRLDNNRIREKDVF